jgi:large subunit ribosomal protein L18
VLAEWSRTRGEHIAEYAERQDGLYSGEFDATELPEHFDETRERLMDADTEDL